jgi:hypothetical protein
MLVGGSLITGKRQEEGVGQGKDKRTDSDTDGRMEAARNEGHLGGGSRLKIRM